MSPPGAMHVRTPSSSTDDHKSQSVNQSGVKISKVLNYFDWHTFERVINDNKKQATKQINNFIFSYTYYYEQDPETHAMPPYMVNFSNYI